MANDVTNILENMKLITDEEEVISISNEGRKEGRDWKLLSELDWKISYM